MFPLPIIRQNHHKNKQFYRKQLYDLLNNILKNIDVLTHFKYLKTYIINALECFVFVKSRFTNNQTITIINKNKLKNIIYFISNRDCYGLDNMSKLCTLYDHI